MLSLSPGSRAAVALALGALSLCAPVRAQQLGDVQAPKEPLTLEQQGSFFVGGRPIHVEITEWGELGPDFAKAFGMPGQATVDQMYVQFQIPAKKASPGWPLIMVHGSSHTAACLEATPDGREGCFLTSCAKATPLTSSIRQGAAARDSTSP